MASAAVAAVPSDTKAQTAHETECYDQVTHSRSLKMRPK